MDEDSIGLLSDLDIVNHSDTNANEVNKTKKKSKTLNRLRKLKKTNGTISPNTNLSPRPPSEKSDRNLSHSSLGDLFNGKETEQNATNKDASNKDTSIKDFSIKDFSNNDASNNDALNKASFGNETSTPVKVNSAFVANVYFGGSPHRPTPPPKITDGKSSVADKPKPIPRRRIITPPISRENTVQELKHQNDEQSKDISVVKEEKIKDSPVERKSSSTLNIRESIANDPVPPPRVINTTVKVKQVKADDVKDIEAEKSKPFFVFDPATGEMVVKENLNQLKPENKTSSKDGSDESSEDDIVIPIKNNFSKSKTSNKSQNPNIKFDQQMNESTKDKKMSTNVSESVLVQKTSTPIKNKSSQFKDSLSLNGNLEKSDDDDVIVVSVAQKSETRTTNLPNLKPSPILTTLPEVNPSEPKHLVGKPPPKAFITSSPLPVKQVIETESAFIVKPRNVPSKENNASQESGVESDRASTGSTSPEDESNTPGTSTGRLPSIHSKHSLPPLPQSAMSLRTSYKIDENLKGGRTGSLPFSEPVMGADDTLSMTNRSFMSTGAIPTLTTKALKNRSYLSNGLQATNSLLGKEELERYFPDRQLKIYMATWNMHSEKEIPNNLEELLLPDDTVFVQDIYAIGTQESCPEKQEWEVSIQQVLGPTHVLLHSASHGVLNLLIFIRRDLIWFCSPIEEGRVSTRVGSMIKTKGAMAVAFNFFGTSLLFIASHLTSGDEKLKERILDYEKIITTLDLPVKDSPIRIYNKKSADVTAKFDCVFWCGDFNFRIDLQKERVEKWISSMRKKDEPNLNKLLKEDQLIKEMKRKEVFKHFKEDDIRFFPTYKFDLNTDKYDTSPKARVPSYTDRILYRSRKPGDINPHVYNSCEAIKMSDHRPVYAIFTAKIRPGRHDMPTGGGQFSRNVFVEGNKRRAEAMRNEKASSVCAIL